MARLDQELVSRGLARSRTHAAKLIAAGRVLRGRTVLTKASAAISRMSRLAWPTTADPTTSAVPGTNSRAHWRRSRR